MKHLSAIFPKLLAVVTGALTLASCNRSEYAMLPKSSSYHGVSRLATPVPAEKAPAATLVPTAIAKPAEAAIVPAAPAAVAPAASPAKPAAVVATPAPSVAAEAATVVPLTTPRKLNLVQRLALAKVTRKLDKNLAQASPRQHENTASTAKGSITGNLRIGIILLLVGLLVGFLNSFIGGIIAIIGLIFVVLWLLDNI
jgi:hypothetical protein